MEKIKIKGRVYSTLTSAQKRHIKKVRALISEELPELIRRNQLAHDARRKRGSAERCAALFTNSHCHR